MSNGIWRRVLGMATVAVSFSALPGFGGETGMPPDSPPPESPVHVIEEVVVVGRREAGPRADVPARIEVITAEQIARMPGLKVDEIIQRVSGVVTSRTGLADMRPVVGLRGLGAFEQGRVLVLVDGVPVNKTDNGDVNWHRLDPAAVHRIEIQKGPGSAMYGTYAMGGVINIVTKGAGDRLRGELTAEAGTDDTWGGRLSLAGPLGKGPTGPYFTLSGLYRETDGYEAMSDYNRSRLAHPAEDVMPLWLDEWSLSPTLGWRFDERTRLELNYSHYHDRRSEGRRGDDEPEGEYRHFTTDAWRAHYESGSGDILWHADGYYQLEQYYKLYDRPAPRVNTDVDSDREDLGLILHMSLPFLLEGNRLGFGGEIRRGAVEAEDLDQTGGGFIRNRGTMTLYGIYLQNTYDTPNDRMHLSLGLRGDVAAFTDGAMSTDPANLFSGYINGTAVEDESWFALSPSAGLRLDFTDTFSGYLSYSRGFRAPELDDLCRTGWQYVGPKIANPELEPETVDSFELGWDWHATSRMVVNASAYYTIGHDFLYYVDTGIPVAGGGYWATRNYQVKQNVGEVRIYGAELDLRFEATDDLSFYAAYAFSDSEIVDYRQPDFAGATDLEGKSLRDAPRHMVTVGADILTPAVNLNLNARWRDTYFTDDVNSNAYETDPYVVFDLRLWRDLTEHARFSLDVRNLFDERETDTPGGSVNGFSLASQNPGRTITASLTMHF